MRKVLVAVLLFLLTLGFRNGYCAKFQEQWKDISYGIDEIDLKTIAVGPNNPDIIYAGSAKSIFKSQDGGKTWQKLYLIRGTLTAVNAICIDPKNQDCVYAGTQNGLYKTSDAGLTWNRLFEGTGAQEKEIRHMVIETENTEQIYLGTANGIFITSDGGRIWNKSTGEISNRMITFIAINPIDPNIVYAAAQTGIFKSKDHGLTWDSIFITGNQSEITEIEEIAEEINNDEPAISSDRIPNCIVIDNQDINKIYI
ncbi:MAG: hypothetical protein PHY56_08075, partial [Candidatus Omnitrophica bacterium]|nr:hypothetical protein [Candidatus Omnitrophota bacterium]